MSLKFGPSQQFGTLQQFKAGTDWRFLCSDKGHLLLIIPNQNALLDLSLKNSYALDCSLDRKVVPFEGTICIETDLTGRF